jgi:hypothetical protein
MKFTATVKSGQLYIHDKMRFQSYLNNIARKSDSDVIIDIKRPRRGVSAESRGYYWAVIVPILAEHLGLSENETHDCLRYEFLKEEVEIDGKTFIKVKSTESLDSGERADYHSRIITWASTFLRCFIPKPNEDMSQYADMPVEFKESIKPKGIKDV